MVAISMMSANMATLGFLQIKVFWNKGFDVITYVIYLINKILSCDSNYILDMVRWPNFGKSRIPRRDVWEGFDEKNHFFKVWFYLKFNNLGLAHSMVLKFYTGVIKGLKLKVRNLGGGGGCTYRGKTGRGGGSGLFASPILNRVKWRHGYSWHIWKQCFEYA